MSSFIACKDLFNDLLDTILPSEEKHTKWLNTLSYLENCGARKIAACEHPTLVKEEMLKHASEEFRHAHYLKKQIKRISSRAVNNYSLPHLLGGTASLHYLSALDLQTCRYLSSVGKCSKEIAYLLVTYAIELRAEELYPIYEEKLRKSKSKVTVKSILLEEKEHLNEMREGLSLIPNGFTYANQVCIMEGALCQKWLQGILNQLI